jgi:hypothetical protein
LWRLHRHSIALPHVANSGANGPAELVAYSCTYSCAERCTDSCADGEAVSSSHKNSRTYSGPIRGAYLLPDQHPVRSADCNTWPYTQPYSSPHGRANSCATLDRRTHSTPNCCPYGHADERSNDCHADGCPDERANCTNIATNDSDTDANANIRTHTGTADLG